MSQSVITQVVNQPPLLGLSDFLLFGDDVVRGHEEPWEPSSRGWFVADVDDSAEFTLCLVLCRKQCNLLVPT